MSHGAACLGWHGLVAAALARDLVNCARVCEICQPFDPLASAQERQPWDVTIEQPAASRKLSRLDLQQAVVFRQALGARDGPNLDLSSAARDGEVREEAVFRFA